MVNKQKNTNKQSGGNVAKSTVNLVTSTFNLGISLFTAMDGVMNMPRDLKNAVPPNVQRNEPGKIQEVQPENLPKFNKKMIK